MRGSVVKRGTMYTIVVELSADPVTGKRRQKWHSGFKTRKEAERALIEILGRVYTGNYVANSKQTIGAFLSDWLASIESTVRPATLYSYRRNLLLHVEPYIGTIPLQSLDAGTLNGLYARLLANGRRDREGGLSARSVRYVHTILHRALKDAVRWDRLLKNPVDAATPPRAGVAERPEMLTWDARTLRIFLDASAAEGDRYWAAWYVLATTGMRRGELLGLRWSDVALATATASIRQTVITVKHEVQFGTPKTAKGRRQIALDAGSIAVLKEHRVKQAEERLVMGAGWSDHGLVFTKHDGSPMHPDRFSREFERRVERYPVPRIRLHDLRHTWATLALAAGVHPKVVQERLGHANVSITLDVYSHATPALQSSAAETVAASVFGALG